MSQSTQTPTIVPSYSEGVKLANQMFLDMGDDRVVNIRTTGTGIIECYTDSGSDDYFYFKIENNDN